MNKMIQDRKSGCGYKCAANDVDHVWRVFRVKIKCIVTAQIELPNELFSYVMIVSR